MTTSGVGSAKQLILVKGQLRLCGWPRRLLPWYGSANSASIVQMLLAEISATFDVSVADQAARIFQLQSRPLTNVKLRAVLDWLDVVRVTRPIQLSVAKFDRLLAQLSWCHRRELSIDHYNLLFGHLIAYQTKAPNQFTQATAENALADALAQIYTASQRLQAQLTQPDSIGFRRIFMAAVAQNPQLEIVAAKSSELRSRVAAITRAEVAAQSLITRHQIIASLSKTLVQMADQTDAVRVKPAGQRRRPLTRLINLTQLSPDQLPD